MGALRLGHAAPPSAVHLLFGYRDGTMARHVVPDAVVLPGDPESAVQTTGHLGGDVAFLHLREAIPGGLPPLGVRLAPGTALALAGYGQDRSERMTADTTCHVRGYTADTAGRVVLVHDCTGTRGGSGGPVLARDADGGWQLVGMEVAAERAGSGGVAVPGFTLERMLAGLEKG